ncbi:MAG: glycosyltransferase family 1 protein [Anaerolineae bacterium]|nr:glycosyltransferase family 4 protein [Thermoflexales bacterium]MDW8407619.1 glycosyltransferase family 1 protein [Anaerolineae bacterium]
MLIDVSPAVHRKAGLGRYAEELTAALSADASRRDEYAVFYHAAGQAELGRVVRSLPAVVTTDSHYRWRLRALLAQLVNLSQDRLLAHAPSIRLFHATEHLLPRFKRVRTVFTLHDLIFKFYPQYHLPRNWLYLQIAMPVFLRRADAVICVSESTRRDALRVYRLPEEKLHVIYEGVHPRFQRITDPAECRRVRDRLRLPERYVLAVGTVEPRKNLATLFQAYRAYLDGCPDQIDPPPILVAGKQGWLEADSYRAVHRHRLSGLVRFLGYVDDADLPALYSMATVFVMPSVYEGFGLPVLEAMACGAPVICSNAASLPEVAGDAALLVAPIDVAGWAKALQRALGDAGLRADLAARGLRRAAHFTWAEAARQTRETYNRLLAPV